MEAMWAMIQFFQLFMKPGFNFCNRMDFEELDLEGIGLIMRMLLLSLNLNCFMAIL